MMASPSEPIRQKLSCLVRRAPAEMRSRRCVVLIGCALVAAACTVIVRSTTRRSTVCFDGHCSDSERSETAATTRQRAIAAAFRPRMSAGEKAAALLCLGAFDAAMRNARATYFLYGGTLLGARRHRGFVPWDDDVDVLANFSQVSCIERALRSVAGYELHVWHRNRYKFYARDGAPIRGKAWRWPYVDVCFFDENATHVYDNFPGLSAAFSYAKVDVFPLACRPFDGLLLPSPANEERVLARNYEEQTCQSNQFSHRDETQLSWSDVMSVPCSELYTMYPFIFRNGSTPPIVELLIVSDQVVARFNIRSQSCTEWGQTTQKTLPF